LFLFFIMGFGLWLILNYIISYNTIKENENIRNINRSIRYLNRLQKRGKIITNRKCKRCNFKFGYDKQDFDAPIESVEYYVNRQPKWRVRIFGKTWYYCSDKCLSKDFKKMNGKWVYYKKKPKSKFNLRLTETYKIKRQFANNK